MPKAKNTKDGTYINVYSNREKRAINKVMRNGATGDSARDLRTIFVYCEANGINFEVVMKTKGEVIIQNS